MIVEVLNLSANQIECIKSQTCNSRFTPDHIIGMRYHAHIVNASVMGTFYELEGWNHGGGFNGWFRKHQLKFIDSSDDDKQTKQQPYSDELEELVGKTLENAKIRFERTQRLDFYLPDFNIYIEVKKFHSERSIKQLASQDDVIFLQGRNAIKFFCDKINK